MEIDAVWRWAPKPRWFFILALGVVLGAVRFNSVQPQFDQKTLATYNDQQHPVIVESPVVGEPDVRDTLARTNLRVEVDKLVISDQPTRTVKGLVLIQTPPFTDFRYGDRIRAEGKLQTPTDSGDFFLPRLSRSPGHVLDTAPAVGAGVISRPGVTARSVARDLGFAPLVWLAPFTGCAFKAHATLTRVIAQTLCVPEPQASLLTGILLGDDAGVSILLEAFRITGTSQILAISG